MNVPVHDRGVDEIADASDLTGELAETKRQSASIDSGAEIVAARLLVEAYRRGEERGGSMEWDDVGQAYEAALRAVGKEP